MSWRSGNSPLRLDQGLPVPGPAPEEKPSPPEKPNQLPIALPSSSCFSWLPSVGSAFLIFILVSLLSTPASLWGQESARKSGNGREPLLKSDVVELLVFDAHERSEIVEAIRFRCLSFSPTSGDLQDFRRLGAEDAVMQAIRECAGLLAETGGFGSGRDPRQRTVRTRGKGVVSRSEVSPAAASGMGSDGRPGAEEGTLTSGWVDLYSRSSTFRSPVDLRLVFPLTGVDTMVGDTVDVRIQARRGGAPAGGVRISARGGPGLTAAVSSPLVGVTDSAGESRLELPVPIRPGEFFVRVVGEGNVTDTLTLRFRARPGPPNRILATPRTLRLRGRIGELSVRVRVLDRFGNPVPDLSVQAILEDGLVVRKGITDPEGRWTLRFPKRGLEAGMTVKLEAGGRRLLAIPVRR